MGSVCFIRRSRCICDLPLMGFGWNFKQTNEFCWVLVGTVNERMKLVGFRVKIGSLAGFCCFGDTEFWLSDSEVIAIHITEISVIAYCSELEFN